MSISTVEVSVRGVRCPVLTAGPPDGAEAVVVVHAASAFVLLAAGTATGAVIVGDQITSGARPDVTGTTGSVKSRRARSRR